jgi:hypothetical protein
MNILHKGYPEKIGYQEKVRFLVVLLAVAGSLHPLVGRSDDVHFHFHEEDDDDDDDSNLGLYVLGAIAAGIGITSPFWAPTAMIDDGSTGFFLKYPYEQGGGFMRLEGDPAYEPWAYSLRWSSEYGYDFDGVERFGTNIHLETTSRLGIDAELSWFDQHDDQGVAVDEFWVGDANAILRFAQSHHAQWWTGAGVNWIDDVNTQYGFNLTYGADIFLGDPWILSGAMDYGKIGDEDFFHGRLALGANWKTIEGFIGYDYLNAGSREHDTLMVGLRTWW